MQWTKTQVRRGELSGGYNLIDLVMVYSAKRNSGLLYGGPEASAELTAREPN